MCGIFGLVTKEGSGLTPSLLEETVNRLFKLSESRGKEASGIAVLRNQAIKVYKQPIPASALIRTQEYKKIYEDLFGKESLEINHPVALVGHSRLVTNGAQEVNDNNQPVSSGNIVGVHNGIIVNDEALWERFTDLQRKYEVDTEVLLKLIQKFYHEKASLIKAVQDTFTLIEGSASIALLSGDSDHMILATNTGSLYQCRSESGDICLIASERFILETLLKHKKLKDVIGHCIISQIRAGNGCLINIKDFTNESFNFSSKKDLNSSKTRQFKLPETKTNQVSDLEIPKIRPLRRCTKCILPETMPFIEFDNAGVCNYCNGYKKMELLGHKALENVVSEYRSKSGEPDCIVAFSGGRDSSYGLHYIKNVLGLNPIAYTYDWGMVTDIARRNAARICGKLGVEHIIISADINTKRNNIRKNVEAWLKKPDLGMIPLFMAGDKQFYYYANKLKKQTGIKLFFFSAGNSLENTDFKTGFCGISKGSSKGMLTNLSLKNKLKLANYYVKQFVLNPAYINSSIFDTMFAYFSSYFINHDYLYLYHYVKWDEKEIMKILVEEYDWEVAGDTKVVWRIGDGTASFYNYIYYIVAGFTENDTFRSNQIREGIIDRKEALELVMEENKPRFDAIKAYCDQIGVDFHKVLKIIDSIPKLYEQR